MKTNNFKWIAYALSALMLMQSCKVYQDSTSTVDDTAITQKRETVKPYKVWVTLMDGMKHKGILYAANEEGLKLIRDINSSTNSVKSIELHTIKTIEVRRKGKVGRGALIGLGSGLIIGGGIGYLTYEGEHYFAQSKSENALLVGIPLGILGSGIGALVGTKKEIMVINRNKENFKMYLPLLKKCSLTSVSFE